MRYGVGYQGSKNQIASELMSVLPNGKRFVDLFAGGCAMTHAAMLSGKYERFLANDLHGMGVRLFVGGINGEFDGRFNQWVSRDEFYAKRDTDPLIAICWSFGNNQSQYLYPDEKAAYKKQCFELTVSGRREEAKKLGQQFEGHRYRMQSAEAMHRILELQEWNGGGKAKDVERSFKTYEDVPHEDGDVVYCDIPYRSATETYRFMKRSGITFDFDKFYAWALSRDYPVFVSEYEMPSDFVSIWTKAKLSIFNKKKADADNGGGYGIRSEHLFVQKRFADLFSSEQEISQQQTIPQQMLLDL